jgi:ADP-heptose:LPS heptosyltransferase
VKYLLVRLRLIGDVVFTTPLLRALRQTRPNAHITYLVEPLAAPVVRNNPHLDEVLIIPKRSGLRRWADDLLWARRLRARRFDVAIDLHGGPRASFLTWATGAPMRVGYRMAGHSWMYTHVVDRADDLLPRHSVLKQWDLLAPFGIDAADPARDAVEMTGDSDAGTRIDDFLRGAGFAVGTSGAPRHQLVMMHVSAGNPFRRWPQQAFADTLVDLARRDPARRFLVTSGPSDADAAHAIVDMARARLGPAAGAAITHGQFEVAELGARAAGAGGRSHRARPVRGGRTSRAGRPRGGVHWGRQRSAAHRRHHADAHRGALRPDAGRAFHAVARPAMVCRGGRRRAAAVPAVPPAAL